MSTQKFIGSFLKPFSISCRDEGLCVFSQIKKSLSSSEILNIILGKEHENKITDKVPIGVKKNATYVIDTSKLASPNDVRADDLGVWVNNGVRRTFVTCNVSCGKVKNIEVIKSSCFPVKAHQIVRSYFYHKHSKDFKRSIIELLGELYIEVIRKFLLSMCIL